MPLTRAQVRVALTIAGSDSGGGAGLAADLKTFLAHRVHGAVAVTCVTAQDTVGVRAIERLPTGLVQAQIVAVLDDLAPEVAKTGFLAGLAAINAIEAVADRLPPLIVDPVCVDKHDRPILDDATLEALRYPHREFSRRQGARRVLPLCRRATRARVMAPAAHLVPPYRPR